jgi:hypothetical protein
MEDQTSTNITAFVMRNGADCSWTLGAASQITLCSAQSGAAA